MPNSAEMPPFRVGRRPVVHPYWYRIATVVALTFLLPSSYLPLTLLLGRSYDRGQRSGGQRSENWTVVLCCSIVKKMAQR